MVTDMVTNTRAASDAGADELLATAPMDGVIRFLERAATMKAKKGLRVVEKDQDPGPEAA